MIENEIEIKSNVCSLLFDEKSIEVIKNTYQFAENSRKGDLKKRNFANIELNGLIEKLFASKSEKDFCVENDFDFYGSGYQSWGFGGEIQKGRYQKKYIPLVPQFSKYIEMPGKESGFINLKKKLCGQFVIYFRWNNLYLVVASTGNVQSNGKNLCLPPVEFSINRKERILRCSVDSFGKKWTKGDVISELSVFAVHNFFELKEAINQLYKNEEGRESRFSKYESLSIYKDKIVAGGWESWYNHYSFINEELILKDLNSLPKSDNIINSFIAPKTKNSIFQVDDGWEKAAGDWNCNLERFPNGMANLAEKISEKGYVPGLWIAPFIIDYRSEFCKEHKNWVLKNKNGKPVYAGYNPIWGDTFGKNQPSLPNSFFCLDLSLAEVQQYLDSLMEKVIDEWGFRYIKLDFLYAGMLVGKYQNDGASYEFYNKAVQTLTSRKTNNHGEEVFYLGCGMPFELSYNSLPLSRIGPDTKEDWDVPLMKNLNFSGRTSAFKNMQSTLGHAFWNGSVFINDPDVIFLRNKNISLNQTEKELISLVNFLFAGQIMHSDDPADFEEETEGELTKKIISLYEKFSSEEFGLINISSDSYFIFSKSKKYYGVINLCDEEIEVSVKDMILSWGDTYKSLSLIPVVNHTDIQEKLLTHKQTTIRAERHSISIFQLD